MRIIFFLIASMTSVDEMVGWCSSILNLNAGARPKTRRKPAEVSGSVLCSLSQAGMPADVGAGSEPLLATKKEGSLLLAPSKNGTWAKGKPRHCVSLGFNVTFYEDETQQRVSDAFDLRHVSSVRLQMVDRVKSLEIALRETQGRPSRELLVSAPEEDTRFDNDPDEVSWMQLWGSAVEPQALDASIRSFADPTLAALFYSLHNHQPATALRRKRSFERRARVIKMPAPERLPPPRPAASSTQSPALASSVAASSQQRAAVPAPTSTLSSSLLEAQIEGYVDTLEAQIAAARSSEYASGEQPKVLVSLATLEAQIAASALASARKYGEQPRADEQPGSGEQLAGASSVSQSPPAQVTPSQGYQQRADGSSDLCERAASPLIDDSSQNRVARAQPLRACHAMGIADDNKNEHSFGTQGERGGASAAATAATAATSYPLGDAAAVREEFHKARAEQLNRRRHAEAQHALASMDGNDGAMGRTSGSSGGGEEFHKARAEQLNRRRHAEAQHALASMDGNDGAGAMGRTSGSGGGGNSGGGNSGGGNSDGNIETQPALASMDGTDGGGDDGVRAMARTSGKSGGGKSGGGKSGGGKSGKGGRGGGKSGSGGGGRDSSCAQDLIIGPGLGFTALPRGRGRKGMELFGPCVLGRGPLWA